MKVRHGWLLETHGTGPNVRAAASEVAVVTGRRELDMPRTCDVQTMFNIIRDVCAFIAFLAPVAQR